MTEIKSDKTQIRMIALDLDGTTLNEHKRITRRTIKSFREAMEKGIHIVISTGRTFDALPKQLFTIEGLEYVVTSNGAMITELATMDNIYSNCLTEEAVEAIVAKIKDRVYSIETFVGGKAYIDEREYNDIVSDGSTYRDADYVKSTRNPIPDICGFILQNKDRIENISLNFEFMDEKEEFKKTLAPISNITMTSSFIHNIEIGGANTSKAEALRFLMERLDVKSDNLMACGDSHNDLRMIEMARIGVVMENASEEMKQAGDYITESNNHNGVAKAIEKFAL